MYALTRFSAAERTRVRVFALLLLIFAFSPLASKALTEGDYTYETNGLGQATITGFNTSYWLHLDLVLLLAAYLVGWYTRQKLARVHQSVITILLVCGGCRIVFL